MDAVNSVHSFGLFLRAPQFLSQRIAGSGYENETKATVDLDFLYFPKLRIELNGL